MSWLLVAFIPGLLVLVTFGLDRLEAGLKRDTLTAGDVAEFLELAEAAEMSALARQGMPEALECLHRRQRAERYAEAAGVADRLIVTPCERGRPTPRHRPWPANP